jgi:amidase
MRQMLTIGGLARSIQDLRLCFQLIAGADASQSDIPPVPLDQPDEQLLQTRRIAWSDEWSLYPVATEIKSAMQSAATKLIEARITVEKWVPNFDFPFAWQTYYKLAAYNLIHAQSLTAGEIWKHLAFLFRDSFQGDRTFRKLGNLASIGLPISLNPTLKGYFETLTERDKLIAQMDQELAQWDVWLCPVAMTTAFPHCDRGAAIQADNRSVPYSMASGAYVVPFNVTGHPAVVIPIGQTQNGLPIGMQIVGQRWREMELFAISQELDKVVGNFRNPLGY